MGDWYDATGAPATNSLGASSTIRSEFSAIETALSQMPTLTGAGDEIVKINSGGTALESVAQLAVSQGGTGASSLTDGGVLLGSGTGAITAMAALADGAIVIGDGTTDPVSLAAFSSSTGTLNVTSGGTGTTTSTGTGSVVLGTAPTLTGATMAGELSGADNTVSRVNLKDYGEVTNAIGSTGGGTQDIDLEQGNVVSATVDTSANTFTFSNPTASDEGCSFTLFLTNGGSQTVNWPASVDWAGATAPTLTASGLDILVFVTIDGGTIWHGMIPSTDSK